MADLMQDFSQTGTGGDAFNVAIFAIVSMIVLVGISYLFSRILRDRKLEDWAKNEFIQVLISAAIVGSLVLLLSPTDGLIIKVFNSMIPQGGLPIPVYDGDSRPVSSDSVFCTGFSGTMLCYAFDYLSLLQMNIINISTDLIWFSTIVDIISKISIDIIVVQVTPFSGFSSVVQVCNNVLSTLIFLGVIIGVEMALIIFISKTALSFFLPIGVVLRCFFATRRIGGLLMAIALGLYIVFPLAISMNAVAVEQSYASDLANFSKIVNTVKGADPYGQGNQKADILDAGVWSKFMQDSKSVIAELIGMIGKIPEIFIKILAALVVQIVFLPMLSVMITAIAIKELAGLFGSEVNLSRFEV